MPFSVQLGLLLALATAFARSSASSTSTAARSRRPTSRCGARCGPRWRSFAPLVHARDPDRDRVVGVSRRGAVAGPDLAGAVGDRRRAGAADGERRPALRPRGDPARVDRRRARRRRPRLPRRHARGHAPTRRTPATRSPASSPTSPAARSRPSRSRRRGPLAAFARASSSAPRRGLFWAASDIAIKALSGEPRRGRSRSLLDPLAAVIALASFAGLVVSARSLQVGKAVPVIAVTSVAANLLTIAAGPVVFQEPLPDDSARRRRPHARLRPRDRGRGADPGAGRRRRGGGGAGVSARPPDSRRSIFAALPQVRRPRLGRAGGADRDDQARVRRRGGLGLRGGLQADPRRLPGAARAPRRTSSASTSAASAAAGSAACSPGSGSCCPASCSCSGSRSSTSRPTSPSNLDELFYGLKAAVGAMVARALVRLSQTFITDAAARAAGDRRLRAHACSPSRLHHRPARRRAAL